MNRKFIVAGAGLLVGGGLAMLALNYYWQRPPESPAVTAKELNEHAARLGIKLPPAAPPPVRAAPPIDPKKPVRLAIGWLGLPVEAQNGQVGDLVLAELSGAKNLQLVDRQSLDKVLHEAQMGLSGLVRAADATRVGKLLRADWFMLGSAATVNGSNYVVVRLVDARTGVMLNATVLAREGGAGRLAEELAAFARQSRETASHPGKPRVYLAIGGFKDVGVNDRQADFPAKLRGYLTAAYQGDTNVTLLEREFADVLLQEMQLDLAGLTDEGPGTVQPMQSAFWMVEGDYQSYEVSGFEVELVLRVHRMFGLTGQDTLRGPPEESFYRQIKSRIDQILTQQADQLLMPTRQSEIRAQLEFGKELTRGINPVGVIFWFSTEYRWADSRETRNLEEAMRAFQTVLLLDPENHDAKMNMAVILQDGAIRKDDEALDLIKQVAESSVHDRWKVEAMVALEEYYRYRHPDPARSEEWYHRAQEEVKAHPEVQVGGQINLYGYTRMGGDQSKPPDPEAELVEKTQQMRDQFKSGLVFSFLSDSGIDSFVKSFGTNHAGAVKRLNELLPSLLEKFPDFAPDLLAIALPFQLDTNSTVVAEFTESFQRCAEHPEILLNKPNYFWRVSRNCYNWCMDRKLYALAARLIEVKRRVQMTKGGIEAAFGPYMGNSSSVGSIVREPARIELEDRTRLVYAYMGLGRWQDALDLLGNLPTQPFAIETAGPWGGRSGPFSESADPWEPGGGPWGGCVAPAELTAQCREKLGLPVEKDPRVFALGTPWWIFPTEPVEIPIVFTADQESFWLGVYGRLWKMSLDSETKNEIPLGRRWNSAIMSLCNSPSKLWIGTLEEGLIEYDKQSHESRHFTMKDGLLLDSITGLRLQGDTLWMGFGGYYTGSSGGFGRLDLRTGKATGFTPSLRPHSASDNDPPRYVYDISAGRPDEVYVRGPSDHAVFQRYHIAENTWESLPWSPTVVTADSERLVLGLSETPNSDKSLKGIGIAVQNFADGSLDKFGLSSGLPNTQVQKLALDGNDLWIGGMGFIAVMDLRQKTIRKFCYTHKQTVDRMEIGGGYVWVLMDWSLYRIPISETR